MPGQGKPATAASRPRRATMCISWIRTIGSSPISCPGCGAWPLKRDATSSSTAALSKNTTERARRNTAPGSDSWKKSPAPTIRPRSCCCSRQCCGPACTAVVTWKTTTSGFPTFAAAERTTTSPPWPNCPSPTCSFSVGPTTIISNGTIPWRTSGRRAMISSRVSRPCMPSCARGPFPSTASGCSMPARWSSIPKRNST